MADADSDQVDPRCSRRAGRQPAARVPRRQPRGDVEVTAEGAGDVVAQRLTARVVVAVGHHGPDVERHPLLGAHLRGADREPVQGEHAGDGREQSGPVGRGDGHRPGHRLVLLGEDRQPALPHQRALRGRQRRRRWRRCAVQAQGGPSYQVVHESCLPLAPRGRPGGQRVGPGEGCQQLEHLGGAQLVGHRGDGGRVLQVAPGRVLDEQQVVADEQPDGGDVVGVEAHPLRGGDTERHARPRCGRRASPCRCRAAAPRRAAGPAGAPRAPARTPAPRSRAGGGRR